MLGIMKYLKISVNTIFFQISFILKSEHFLSQRLGKELNIENMHWNLTAHKPLHIKTPEKWSFLWNESVQIFETQIQDFAASVLTTSWLEFCRRMQCILPKNLNIMNNLFSRPFSLPKEIICIKLVIVASAYVFFIQA